jgi:hypothetical protein
MFATSGKTIVLDSAASAASRYVAHEAAAAQRWMTGQRMVLILMPAELVSSGGVFMAGPITVAELSSTPQEEKLTWREKLEYDLLAFKRARNLAVAVLLAVTLLFLRRWWHKRSLARAA